MITTAQVRQNSPRIKDSKPAGARTCSENADRSATDQLVVCQPATPSGGSGIRGTESHAHAVTDAALG